jgi:hypothetical protein
MQRRVLVADRMCVLIPIVSKWMKYEWDYIESRFFGFWETHKVEWKGEVRSA